MPRLAQYSRVTPASANWTLAGITRGWRGWVVLAGAGVALALAGCPHSTPPAKPSTPSTVAPPAAPTPTGPAAYPQPDPQTDAACFAFVGDFRTFLRPCGCTPDQPGGMPRIGSILSTGHALLDNISAAPKAIAPDVVTQLRQALGLPSPQAGAGQSYSAPQRLWLIECGNFNWIGTHNQDVRLGTYLSILHDLGCRAIVPGAGELELQAQDAKALASSSMPIVSCNLKLKQDLFPLQDSVELAPGWYVTGVSSWRALGSTTPLGSWWELTDPVAAVKAVQAGLPPRSKLVVIAAYQSAEVTSALSKLPVAAVIGAGGWEHKTAHEAAGTTELPQMPTSGVDGQEAPIRMPAPPVRGVFLPLLRMYSVLDTVKADTAYVNVDRSWPDDPAIQALLDGQTAKLRDLLTEQRKQENAAYGNSGGFGMAGQYMPEGQQDLTADQLTAMLKAPARYKGSASCVACHAAAAQAWTKSQHTQALDTLTKVQNDTSVDCLQCHTVGLYEPSGYDPNTVATTPHDQLGAVGCESCHGPGSQHILAAQLAKLSSGTWPAPDARWNGAKYSIDRSSTQGCLKCHDAYNSPKFEAGAYWGKIKH